MGPVRNEDGQFVPPRQAVNASGHWDGEFQQPTHRGRVITTIPVDLASGFQFWKLAIYWDSVITDAGVRINEYLDRQIVGRSIRPTDVD